MNTIATPSRTATLAQLMAQTELSIAAGEKKQAGMLQNPKLDLVNVDPLRLLRVSLTRVVEEAQRVIEETVTENTVNDTVYEVQYLVPNTEACFEVVLMLDDGVLMQPLEQKLYAKGIGDKDHVEFMALINEVWTPFKSWLKSEGLLLAIHTLKRPYGVKQFAMFQVQALPSL